MSGQAANNTLQLNQSGGGRIDIPLPEMKTYVATNPISFGHRPSNVVDYVPARTYYARSTVDFLDTYFAQNNIGITLTVSGAYLAPNIGTNNTLDIERIMIQDFYTDESYDFIKNCTENLLEPCIEYMPDGDYELNIGYLYNTSSQIYPASRSRVHFTKSGMDISFEAHADPNLDSEVQVLPSTSPYELNAYIWTLYLM